MALGQNGKEKSEEGQTTESSHTESSELWAQRPSSVPSFPGEGYKIFPSLTSQSRANFMVTRDSAVRRVEPGKNILEFFSFLFFSCKKFEFVML